MDTILKTRSLRFWIALSMTLALVPLAISAAGGFLLFNKGVIASFQDVVHRQHVQIAPVQRLSLLVWEALATVDEYVEDGSPDRQQAYRSLRTRIEAEFAKLTDGMQLEDGLRDLIAGARNEWVVADRHATALFSLDVPAIGTGAVERLRLFHGEVAAITDKLSAVYASVEDTVDEDRNAAFLFYERAMWLSGIAGAVSLIAVVAGVTLIGRIMTMSVDRLVDGAVRFAEGDRDHRIEVKVPPELHRVAEEFNHMIGRIHESEAALSELAHRDGLTGLSNRRAFEESLTQVWGTGSDTKSTLLAIDIDHFKRVNDSHGHAAGDEVLRTVAATMARCLRPNDRIFRTGGEEFAVLLPRTDGVAACDIGERLRQNVEATPIWFRQAQLHVTISIGIAETTAATDAKTWTEAADAALYNAKESGRNRISGEARKSDQRSKAT